MSTLSDLKTSIGRHFVINNEARMGHVKGKKKGQLSFNSDMHKHCA